MSEVIVQQAALTATSGSPPVLPLPVEEDPTLHMGTPYKIELSGDRLKVIADVDLKGLRKLMKVLKAQESLLNLDEEIEENDEAKPA
jgi:hypothetical protein